MRPPGVQLYEDDEEVQAAGLGVFWLAAFHGMRVCLSPRVCSYVDLG